jgi:hypothetical protein
MKIVRCKPGQVCIIIGESAGCEANIGALLTVVELLQLPDIDPVWTFIDASRPLVTAMYNNTCISSSFDIPEDTCYIFDHHLLPIEADPSSLEIYENLELNA